MSRNTDPQTWCTPVADWPRLDADAWAKALEPADPFDPSVGYAMRWKASTRKAIENGYGRWLGWLERSGQLDPAAAPGQRVNRERVTAFRDALVACGNADNTIAGRLQQLGNALRAIDPAGDWGWLHRASSTRRSQAKPVRDIVGRMQPVEDVIALGCDLMHAADTDRFRKPCERALMFRDGLLIAFLVQRPLRIANLTSMTLDRHLQRCGSQWRLEFEADETKQTDRFEWTWPEGLVASLERYLEVHRRQLLTASPKSQRPSQALWLSQRGTAMGYAAIAFQIRDRTEEEFGKAINPHTFRHIAATTIATASPQRAQDIMAVLGHSSMTASEKYYNRAGLISAGASLHASIADLRKGLPKAGNRGVGAKNE